MEKSCEVVLDTNFLLVPSQFRIDIFDEIARIMPCDYEIITLKCVVDELEKIREGKFGMELVEKKGIRVVDTGGGGADDELVRYADRGNVVVCTNDAGLRKRLGSAPMIFMRGKKKLELKW